MEETEPLMGMTLIANAAGWYLPHEHICWISERHNILNLDNRGRLHKDGGLACGYPDGWGVYSWHGTRIPYEWGSISSEHWKPEWLLTAENQEHRRVLIQGLGYERIMKAIPHKIIHTERDMELCRIEKDVDVEPIVLLKVKCPSTAFVYTLRVPPHAKTCEEARRMTFPNPNLELLKET